MAFQFKCSECGAHIEVDDEYRNQKVTCPYCRKPTIAVEETAASDPTAEGAGTQAIAPIEQARPNKTTILGWLALSCIVIGLAMSFYTRSQVGPLLAGLDARNMTQEERTQEIQRRVQSRPELMVFGFLGGCLLPVAGVVLAIICLARKIPPRWPAVVALCIIGGLIAVSCIATMMHGANAPPGAGV